MVNFIAFPRTQPMPITLSELARLELRVVQPSLCGFWWTLLVSLDGLAEKKEASDCDVPIF